MAFAVRGADGSTGVGRSAPPSTGGAIGKLRGRARITLALTDRAAEPPTDDHAHSPQTALEAQGRQDCRAAPVAHTPAGGHPGRRLAGRAAAPVRPRAGLRAGESGRGPGVLGVPRPQPGQRQPLPCRDPGACAGAELLHLPGLRDQRPGHLQAHRIHAGQARIPARRQGGTGEGLPARVQRSLARLRRSTPRAFPRRPELPARAAGTRRRAVRRERRLGAALGAARPPRCPGRPRPRPRPRAALPR